jgi:hypothetical protein
MKGALAPGGRLLLAERLLARTAARSAHGLNRDQAAALAQRLAGGGFTDVRTETRQAGHQTLIIVRGQRGGLGSPGGPFLT